MQNSKNGVILLNMGGPDTLDDVHPFLFNLFSDREIIRLGPAFLQKFLAWIIARRRAPKSRAIYAKIGGGSPLKDISFRQAEALEKALLADGDYTCDRRHALLAAICRRGYTADAAPQELIILSLSLYIPTIQKPPPAHHCRICSNVLQRLAPEISLDLYLLLAHPKRLY